ncbi:MAG: MoxR family ATPase [Anaerolineae bacterium]|jgi:MoxR-like ATPase|nr:MoxR family ATPase [Anaerolineae bacterium]
MIDQELTLNITERLGVQGWSRLDAVLLAALATEYPLLLIGPHGTAKSFLVERIAHALGLEMRHYNAALLNYDDLVGIPLPDEAGESLHFVPTPSTIWQAGFVFFDEISRCRIDLQNKLFPIIHERRVVGIKLDQLRYRWAAMNPPAPDDPSVNSTTTYYLGSEPLDPALTDRFPFVITVPNWGDLSRQDRLRIVLGDSEVDLEASSNLDLDHQIRRCVDLIPIVRSDFEAWLGDYILYLMDLLERGGLGQSPRRARMLAQTIIAVHAARLLLEGEAADIEDSVITALLYGLPQTATDVPPSEIKVIAIHKQAWELAQYLEDEKWRTVMEEHDRARRVLLAHQLGFDDFEMSRLITQTLGAEDSNPRQVGLAVAMFLTFCGQRNLDPSAYEPLTQLAYHVFEPRVSVINGIFPNTPDAANWDDIKTWIESNRRDSLIFRLERNFLLYGFPHFWRTTHWKEALEQFHHDLLLFGIGEERLS